MIKLTRQQLFELAKHYLVSNTPITICRGLSRSETVKKMKNECSKAELIRYYNIVTTRGSRSELVLGLAYGVLMASIMKEAEEGALDGVKADESRLHWGAIIRELGLKMAKGTSYKTVERVPKVIFRESTGSYHHLSKEAPLGTERKGTNDRK